MDQIIIDQNQNINLSNKELFQLEENNNNIQTDPMTNYQRIYQNPKKSHHNPIQKIYKKEQINNPHFITQSLAKKIIQNNNNIDITPINQDLINLNNTCPNQNQIINSNNSNNSNSLTNKSNNTVGINPFNNFIKIKDDINQEYEALTDDNEKLKELAKNIKDNENKIDQMNKTMNEILVSKNKNDDLNEAKNLYMQMNNIEKIQQENIILKADSLIYREDINHLIELNNKYSEELENSRKKILDLISRNNDIEKDINHKDYQINKLNEVLTRLRLYENSDMEYNIKNNKSKDQILHELEFNFKVLEEENNNLNKEKKLLQQKIKDIIDNKKELNKKIMLNNEQNNKMINNMEEKIQYLEKEINDLSNENNILSINNQKNEKEMERLYIERNKIENEFNKKKEEYDKLQNNYNMLNNKYQELIHENNRNLMREENKIDDSERKNKKINKDAINELFSKIQILKSKVQQERDIEEQ